MVSWKKLAIIAGITLLAASTAVGVRSYMSTAQAQGQPRLSAAQRAQPAAAPAATTVYACAQAHRPRGFSEVSVTKPPACPAGTHLVEWPMLPDRPNHSHSPTVTSPATVTVYACAQAHRPRGFSEVSVTKPPACPAGTYLVEWPGLSDGPSPSPSPAVTSPTPSPAASSTSPSATAPATSPSPTAPATSPSPTSTSASPEPSPSAPGSAAWKCTMSSPTGTCGAWDAGASNSNGFNTYTEQNCWGDPNCRQVLSANSFGDYQVVANECCDGTVRTAPQDQQLTNNWCASLGTWENLAGGCAGNISEVPVSRLPRLTATYRESFPHNRQTIAQYAWDNWLNNDAGFPNEVMIWVDINGRCNSGSYGQPVGPPVTIDGQTWQPNQYGTGEFIWVLGGDANCAQQPSGTVDLLSLLKWMQANGFASPGATLAEVDAVWEICSTGGSPETFTVSGYSLADS